MVFVDEAGVQFLIEVLIINSIEDLFNRAWYFSGLVSVFGVTIFCVPSNLLHPLSNSETRFVSSSGKKSFVLSCTCFVGLLICTSASSGELLAVLSASG